MSAAQTPETHGRAATPRRAGLAASVVRVREHLARLPWSFAITIADNASTSASASADGTTVVARRLAHAHPEVRVLHLAEKGRGRGLVSGRLPLAEVSERLGRASADAGGGRLGLQLGIFAIIGVVSTVAYAGLYLLLRGIVDPLWANAAALLVTALGNTAANRRFTFGVRGRAGVVRHQAQGLLVFLVGLAVTSTGLWPLRVLGGDHRAVEVAVLTVAHLAVTAMRFVALRV